MTYESANTPEARLAAVMLEVFFADHTDIVKDMEQSDIEAELKPYMRKELLTPALSVVIRIREANRNPLLSMEEMFRQQLAVYEQQISERRKTL